MVSPSHARLLMELTPVLPHHLLYKRIVTAMDEIFLTLEFTWRETQKLIDMLNDVSTGDRATPESEDFARELLREMDGVIERD
jgi:hypothetical protein